MKEKIKAVDDKDKEIKDIRSEAQGVRFEVEALQSKIKHFTKACSTDDNDERRRFKHIDNLNTINVDIDSKYIHQKLTDVNKYIQHDKVQIMYNRFKNTIKKESLCGTECRIMPDEIGAGYIKELFNQFFRVQKS